MFLFADGMNRSLHSRDQQADLSWVPEGWEHSSNLNELEMRQHQGGRSEWDWEAPLMLSQNPSTSMATAAGVSCDQGDTAADAARKLHLLSGLFRPCSGILPSIHMGSQLSPDQIGLSASSGMQPPLPADTGHGNMHSSLPPSHADFGMAPNFSGLSGGCIAQAGDLVRFDTRRHLMGIMGLDQKGLADFSKPHDLYGAAHEGHAGRIGLNLGVRTYFSTEDSLFGRLNKRARATSPGSQVPMCQAEGCKADLSIAKHYHRRHKVCELHSKAVQVVTNGQNQRFCQQCSRFHPLSEFDEGKRSCRKRLADHNRRRRKPQLTPPTAIPGKSAEPLSIKTEELDQIAADQADGQVTKSSKDKHAQVSETKDGSPPATHDHRAENLQLLTASKGDCSTVKAGTQASLLSTLAASSGSPSESSQALLSPLPTSSPVAFMLKNHGKGQFSGSSPEISQEATAYHHLLPAGMCRGHHLGPNLSLSSSATMQGGGQYIQRPPMAMSQTYTNGMDNTPPWLKAMDLKPGVDHQAGSRDQSVCLDNASQMRHELATSIPSASTSRQQLLPSSIHTLLPFGSSRAMASETSDWMLDSVNRQKKEHSCSRMDQVVTMSLPSPNTLDQRHQRQFISLETAALSDDQSAAQAATRAPILNFLQQKPNLLNSSGQSEESDSADEELSKLRFSELNVLKSFESIYDSHSSFL